MPTQPPTPPSPEANPKKQSMSGREEPVRRRPTRRRRASIDGPDPVDVNVGHRVRNRRVLIGMSQEVLAEKIGLTFQQVQKYELGKNRISASMLWRIAEALDVPVSFFFDGLRSGAGPIVPEEGLTRGEMQVVRGLRNVSPAVRDSVRELLATLDKTRS